MARVKIRIRFRKAGALRFVSHHDLMRCFERMLRRAGIPFSSTEGFNPKPRLVFAQSLALGLVGHGEIADLELDEELSTEEVQRRLAAEAPPELDILSADTIDLRARAVPRLGVYRLPVPPERIPEVAGRAAELMARTDAWVERTRPHPRRLNLRPYLSDLNVLSDSLEMSLVITPNGTARPEEVAEALGLRDVLDAGAVIERVRLELQDNSGPSSAHSSPSQRTTDNGPLTTDKRTS